jgi:hypothetical protein
MGGLAPTTPTGRISMLIRSGGDPALSKNGTPLRSPRFSGRGPCLHPARLWATTGWSLQAARPPRRSIFRLPPRPVRRPMTLRAGGLQAASSVLALIRARHRRQSRSTRSHPSILHRRPSFVGRGFGFRGRAPPPPCGRRDHRCQCLHPSPTAPRGLATAGTARRQHRTYPGVPFHEVVRTRLVAFGIPHSARRLSTVLFRKFKPPLSMFGPLARADGLACAYFYDMTAFGDGSNFVRVKPLPEHPAGAIP